MTDEKKEWDEEDMEMVCDYLNNLTLRERVNVAMDLLKGVISYLPDEDTTH